MTFQSNQVLCAPILYRLKLDSFLLVCLPILTGNVLYKLVAFTGVQSRKIVFIGTASTCVNIYRV